MNTQLTAKASCLKIQAVAFCLLWPVFALATPLGTAKPLDEAALNALLLTPSERQAVLQKRIPADAVSAGVMEVHFRYRLDAVLRRPEGVVWIVNGKSYKAGELLEGIDTAPRAEGNALRVSGQLWRVGETFDTQTGSVTDGLTGAVLSSRLVPPNSR